MLITVSNTRFVKAHLHAGPGVNGSSRTKIVCDIVASSSLALKNDSQGFSSSEFFVDSVSDELSNSTYYAAVGLDSTETYTIRVFNALEPLFHGLDGPGYNIGVTTFEGVSIEASGFALPAPPPPARRLEWVGDSLTAGFGSRGEHPPCETSQLSSSAYYSYTRYIDAALNASSTVIAWSGKGMWKNCCDENETMPQYYLQTLGSDPAPDWAFAAPPSALCVNLGSNDFSKYNGTVAFLREFEAVYIAFVHAALARYAAPALPVLIVQGPFDNAPLGISLQAILTNLTAAGVNAHYVSALVDEADGCQGHPGSTAHRNMSAQLAPQIASVLGWSVVPAHADAHESRLGFFDVVPPKMMRR